MSWLITGGGGFLGANVARTLAAHGEEIVCFDRAFGDVELPANVATQAGDVSDRAQVAEAFRRYPRVDRVVHLAYLMGSESEADPVAAMRVNALGTATVFDEACKHGVGRIVFMSSESIYGRSQSRYGEHGVTEDDYCAPRDHALNYSLTKLVNEHLAAKYEARTSVAIVCLRAPVVYGAGRKRGMTAWASDFATLPALDEAVTLPFPADDLNCYIYVKDLAEQVYALAVRRELAHRVYNAGGETVSAQELAALVRKVVPSARLSFSADRPHSPFVYRMDDSRIRAEIGQLRRPLEDGIRDHVAEVRRLRLPARD